MFHKLESKLHEKRTLFQCYTPGTEHKHIGGSQQMWANWVHFTSLLSSVLLTGIEQIFLHYPQILVANGKGRNHPPTVPADCFHGRYESSSHSPRCLKTANSHATGVVIHHIAALLCYSGCGWKLCPQGPLAWQNPSPLTSIQYPASYLSFRYYSRGW